MKRTIIILAAILFLSLHSNAQSPQKMSYQAVIRNIDNNLIANSNIGLQISILEGSENGFAVYTETHIAQTNDNGLVTIEIGNGTTSENFSSIDWAGNTHFIKTEIDPNGGSTYTIENTSQLMSVPYALLADSCINTKWADGQDESSKYINYSGGDIIVRNEGDYARVRIYTNSEDPDDCSVYPGHRSRGTFDNPLNVQDNDRVVSYNGIYYADGYYRNSAAIQMFAGENVGVNGYPGYIVFGTTSQDELLRVERMRIDSEGNVGINTTNPEAPLHVNDFMKLQPRSSAPSPATTGMIYYDSTDNKVKVYTGSIWEDLN